MTFIELIILAATLSFDTFAVSIGGGISMPNMSIKKRGLIVSFFSVFQTSFLFLGWLIGGKFANYITNWDHWVALVILCYLGIKMVKGSFDKDNDDNSSFNATMGVKKIVFLSVATSIDAIAIGVSLALIHLPINKMGVLLGLTFIITALASIIGLISGQKLGVKVGKKAELIGGIVLILIGIKVLCEHLFFAA